MKVSSQQTRPRRRRQVAASQEAQSLSETLRRKQHPAEALIRPSRPQAALFNVTFWTLEKLKVSSQPAKKQHPAEYFIGPSRPILLRRPPCRRLESADIIIYFIYIYILYIYIIIYLIFDILGIFYPKKIKYFLYKLFEFLKKNIIIIFLKKNWIFRKLKYIKYIYMYINL
jgi:hypothetical protein